MSRSRISVVITIAIGVIGLFGVLNYLRPVPSIGRTIGAPSQTEHTSYQIPERPYSKDANSPSFKIPGELPGFTPHVWQTTGPKPITTEQADDMASWRAKHPFFEFSLMTDEQADSFVSEHYSNRSDIVDLFLRLPIPIVKADLFRYLVLVAQGGVYADIDVLCEKAMETWLPKEQLAKIDSINLIVGLEFDFEFRGEGVEVASQFTNWALAAKPGSKHLMRVVDMAVAGIYAAGKKHNVDLEHIELGMFKDVVNIAGPKTMTIGILESLSEDLGKLVDDRMISNTKKPRLVGDVMILPNNAFAAMQAGWPTDRGPVLVTHHYAGSWKEAADAAKEQKHKAGGQ